MKLSARSAPVAWARCLPGGLTAGCERFVAIKVLSPRLSATPDLLERFQREARAVAALTHPNICTIYDIGPGDAATPPFIAMELLEGETLHRRLHRGRMEVVHLL